MSSSLPEQVLIPHSTIRAAILGTGTMILILLFWGTALAQPPEPGLPYGLPGDVATGPAGGDQTDPAIAAGGDLYLIVWTDERTAVPAGGAASGSGRDIYAARLDAAGSLIDTTPLVITQAPGDQYDPVVVWNGTNWLVLWTGSEPYLQYATPKIEALRVSPSGEMLDPVPFLLWDGGTTLGTSGDHLFAATGNGTDWALIVADQYIQGLGTKVRLIGLRVRPDGTVVQSTYPLYSPSCCSFFYKGGMAYADGVYMAVFEGYFDSWDYGIFGLRLNDDLVPLDSYPLELVRIAMQSETRYYRQPGIAAGNGMYYLAWNLYISGVSSQVIGARVMPDGTSLDGDGVPLSGILPVDLYLAAEPVWDGVQWRVGWSDGTLAMGRVSAGGAVLDPGGVDLGLVPGPFASIGGGITQHTWAEVAGIEPTPFDVFRTAVSSDLVPGTAACVSLGAPSQVHPDLATGADSYLLTYLSVLSAENRIMVHPLGPDGDPLLVEPVMLASGDLSPPRCAFDGTNYLVVWGDRASGAVLGRRLTPSGTVLDGDDLVLLDGGDPDVSGAQDLFFVTASRPEGVFGTRVGGDGSIMDTPALNLATGPNLGPRTANLGGSFLVTWEVSGTTDGGEIALALVLPSGGLIGPLAVTEDGDGLAHHLPAIAGGDVALISWEDNRSGDWDIYGTRIGAPLEFLDPGTGFPLAEGFGDQRAASMAWDGVEFLTGFTDNRVAVDALDFRTDVYRGWVQADGVVPKPGGEALLATPAPETDPALAGRDGNGLYAAAAFDESAPFAAYRMVMRRGMLPSGVEDDPADVPRATEILSLFPNPANPRVHIRYALARSGPVLIDIHDVQGARVRTILTGAQTAGPHTVTWDGRGDDGRALPSGTYLVRVQGGETRGAGKVMLVR